jgi:hypothetical protein
LPRRCSWSQGAVSFSHGKLISIERESIDRIDIGKSTTADIIKEFGEPRQKTYKPGGVEVYIYQHALERGVAIPFLITIGGSGGSGQRLQIFFKGGVVVDWALYHRPEKYYGE